ncbi:hypothetical protein FB451DRAFT_1172362 [Mycena latifolia]|nr:hypothetical protein FB451DRAFT_1172362 [Mycena latifolia]
MARRKFTYGAFRRYPFPKRKVSHGRLVISFFLIFGPPWADLESWAGAEKAADWIIQRKLMKDGIFVSMGPPPFHGVIVGDKHFGAQKPAGTRVGRPPRAPPASGAPTPAQLQEAPSDLRIEHPIFPHLSQQLEGRDDRIRLLPAGAGKVPRNAAAHRGVGARDAERAAAQVAVCAQLGERVWVGVGVWVRVRGAVGVPRADAPHDVRVQTWGRLEREQAVFAERLAPILEVEEAEGSRAVGLSFNEFLVPDAVLYLVPVSIDETQSDALNESFGSAQGRAGLLRRGLGCAIA